MQKLEELIAALEKSERGDRNLDVAICEAVMPLTETYPYEMFRGSYTQMPMKWGKTGYLIESMKFYVKEAPRLTSSIDAAVALVERVLPATTKNIRIASDGSAHAQIFSHTEHRGLDPKGQHAVPAIAICIAALRAKLSQEKNNADK